MNAKTEAQVFFVLQSFVFIAEFQLLLGYEALCNAGPKVNFVHLGIFSERRNLDTHEFSFFISTHTLTKYSCSDWVRTRVLGFKSIQLSLAMGEAKKIS